MDLDTFMDLMQNASDEHAGHLLNSFADEFRGGRTLLDLAPMLQSADSRFVVAAAWIAGEVAPAARIREIIHFLVPLLRHPDAAVRFEAMKSVADGLEASDAAAMMDVLRLLGDPNSGVRRQALFVIRGVPISALERIVDDPWRGRVSLLLNGSKDRLLDALRSGDLIDQRIAVVGVLRRYSHDRPFLDLVIGQADQEVRSALASI